MLNELIAPWSLFVSATAYERGEAMDEYAVADFSALVDIFCLHDKIDVLGDPRREPFLGHSNPLIQALHETKVIKVLPVALDKSDAVVKATCQRLQIHGYNIDQEILLSQVIEAVGLRMGKESRQRLTSDSLPSCPSWLSIGEPNALRLSGRYPPQEIPTHAIRTFYYQSLSDLMRTSWVPDSRRVDFAEYISAREGDFATELRQKLRLTWKSHPRMGRFERVERSSPFSAIVIMRAKGDKRRLAEQILKLRQELAPIRARLVELEYILLYGTRDQSLKAHKKWNKVLDELDYSFGEGMGLMSLSQGLSLAEAVAALRDEFNNAENWMKLASIPVAIADRLLTRRPLAQIHRIRKQLPAPGKLDREVRRLFGQEKHR